LSGLFDPAQQAVLHSSELDLQKKITLKRIAFTNN
jgi:hypothetical protein